MVKIISITNHHQWDGETLSEEEYDALLKTLEKSKYHYKIKSETIHKSEGD